MKNKKSRKRFNEILKDEAKKNKEICLWMSFRDTKKPKGSRFLGVIIIKTLGLSHAIKKTHELGINPNGDIRSCEVNPSAYEKKHFDVLLSESDLRRFGYID